MLEADLQRVYGIDLCDVWRGTLTLRKLRVLIDHLPPDSMSIRQITGVDGPLASWSLADVLLGRAVDEIAALRWQWESAHIDRKRAHRKAPESVLPRAEPRALPRGEGADVIPLVSPHKLGRFIDKDDEGLSNGE